MLNSFLVFLFLFSPNLALAFKLMKDKPAVLFTEHDKAWFQQHNLEKVGPIGQLMYVSSYDPSTGVVLDVFQPDFGSKVNSFSFNEFAVKEHFYDFSEDLVKYFYLFWLVNSLRPHEFKLASYDTNGNPLFQFSPQETMLNFSIDNSLRKAIYATNSGVYYFDPMQTAPVKIADNKPGRTPVISGSDYYGNKSDFVFLESDPATNLVQVYDRNDLLLFSFDGRRILADSLSYAYSKYGNRYFVFYNKWSNRKAEIVYDLQTKKVLFDWNSNYSLSIVHEDTNSFALYFGSEIVFFDIEWDYVQRVTLPVQDIAIVKIQSDSFYNSTKKVEFFSQIDQKLGEYNFAREHLFSYDFTCDQVQFGAPLVSYPGAFCIRTNSMHFTPTTQCDPMVNPYCWFDPARYRKGGSRER